MPRRTRMYIAELPYHIVQRGNNHTPCFFEPEDRDQYLHLWKIKSLRYGVAVHAYCLMTNHIHFLVTPSDPDGISQTMKVVGSRYAAYVNLRYRRTGTLWEGRHRASMIDAENYLLACYRYIELNPVRAKQVRRPDDYAWSSYKFNAYGQAGWLTPHPSYRALGVAPEDAMRCYRELTAMALDEQDLNLIRTAAHYCLPIGDAQFRERVARQYGLTRGFMARGRPRSVKV